MKIPSLLNENIVGWSAVLILPGMTDCKQTLSPRETYWGKKLNKNKRTGGKKMICFPCMCALFMLNDLYKHNWQAEKKNRMTGQEWNLKQQEIKCWICVALGSEWAIFIWHTGLGGPYKSPQFPAGVREATRWDCGCLWTHLPWRHDM